ncbi:glycerol-3-phosphate dehydrogenase/oxidase [Brucella pseudogrignonensis]|uniref:glycerol-3-phosphate dehydrogenase/oxidase n=1 Tax=Brucella pseudogrignonensis TaxID=419475 RepID=UPI0028B627E8|nr:glycerol-3-phosphate dehydrogenase/oxidase [Brucella pseudogrignonensis]MDT6942296.1 glycerol-3-phosphate dehydrogenase/oxidase [Brucella pseudogrignonensis]
MTLAISRIDTVKSHYSVLIIGGGINGCGVFRDLSAQGIDCLLVDKGDFCSGASAAPSRLIHGGIKYLETGEFRLVRQSAMERNLLLKNAPHYVKPLETVLPIYSWFGGIIPSIKRFFRLKAKLNDRGAIITEIGLCLYDLFGRHFRTMPRHRMLLRRSITSIMPELSRRVVASGIYYEGRITHAERLGLELLLDGMQDNPVSIALNYVSVSGACSSGIILTDELTGRNVTVNADIVINAGGAWIDVVNEKLGVATQYMGGNKGSHLIVRNSRLYEALGGRMIYFGSADGRVNLLYPFMGNVLVGSTDIPVRDPELAVCDDAERQYLLNVTREVFPDIEIRANEVIMTYCGVRPLPRSEGIAAGEISRDHSIEKDLIPKTETPVLSLIGGKWTTYRGFSEEAADIVLALLGKPRTCSTTDLPIGGGKDFPISATEKGRFIEDLSKVTGISQVASDLFDRYGTRAKLIAADYNQAGLVTLPAYSSFELAWICRNEHVGRLTDLLFRRTDIALSGRLSAALIAEAATIAADVLNWNAERQRNEIEATWKACHSHGIAI